MFVNLTERLAHRASRVQQELDQLCREMKWRPASEIVARLGAKQPAKEVNEERGATQRTGGEMMPLRSLVLAAMTCVA